jgi:hypothetical protein
MSEERKNAESELVRRAQQAKEDAILKALQSLHIAQKDVENRRKCLEGVESRTIDDYICLLNLSPVTTQVMDGNGSLYTFDVGS